MYHMGPWQKAVSPHPDERFDGEVIVDGQSIRVDGWPGMQGHNWGPKHTHRYIWAHCNAFPDAPPDTFFDGFTAQPKLGPLTVPMLTIVCLRHDGRDFFFKDLKYLLNRSVQLSYYRWSFEAQNRQVRMRGVFEGPREDFVGLYYANPDGATTYCLNTKIATATIDVEPANGPTIRLHAPNLAAFEIGTRDSEHGVRMYV
jgi:hypothetical protein